MLLPARQRHRTRARTSSCFRTSSRRLGLQGLRARRLRRRPTRRPSLNNGLDFDPCRRVAYEPAQVHAALALGPGRRSASTSTCARSCGRSSPTASSTARRSSTTTTRSTRGAPAARAADRGGRITLLRNTRRTLPLAPRKLESIALIGATRTSSPPVAARRTSTPFMFARRAGDRGARRRGRRRCASTTAAIPRGPPRSRAPPTSRSSSPPTTRPSASTAAASLECPPGTATSDALIEAVAEANPRTVVVLETGGPVLTPWRGKVAAIVEAWYPGQAAARRSPACCSAMWTRAAGCPRRSRERGPGARTPATQRSTRASPAGHGTRRACSSAIAGTTRRGAEAGVPVRPRPVVHEVEAASAARTRPHGHRPRANVGRRRGSTVVQLYLGMPSTQAVPQPPRQLRGYRKVVLRPHRSKRIRFRLRPA